MDKAIMIITNGGDQYTTYNSLEFLSGFIEFVDIKSDLLTYPSVDSISEIKLTK